MRKPIEIDSFNMGWFVEANEAFQRLWAEAAEDRRNGRPTRQDIATSTWWSADVIYEGMTPEESAAGAVKAITRRAHLLGAVYRDDSRPWTCIGVENGRLLFAVTVNIGGADA